MHESGSAIQTIACDDLDAAISLHERDHGWRLEMVMPADAPRSALLSRGGERMRLQCRDASDQSAMPTGAARAFIVTRCGDVSAWSIGRAGMHYRDLIPGRLGGRAIASHIRIPAGGDVPDRVHYHDVAFQAIFCRRGWVRVAYEDQGAPLTLQAGDCVLQPPRIRHRVLEASPGLEVIELACPAEHPTWIDHEILLPTAGVDRARRFSGQRFVHHVAAEAPWEKSAVAGMRFRDTGIAQATTGLAGVRVLRIAAGVEWSLASQALGLARPGAHFLHVLDGAVRLCGSATEHKVLEADDSCTILAGTPGSLRAMSDCDVLAVALPQ